MQVNPFQPPTAPVGAAPRAPGSATATWVARSLGAAFAVAGVAGMLIVAVTGTRLGVGGGAIYLLSLLPMASTFAGILVFMRSRHALAASMAATALALLAGPWMSHLARVWSHIDDSPFDYGQALSTRLHRPDPGWLLNVVVIVFCMWDYRRRFAAWRQDRAIEESPPVGPA